MAYRHGKILLAVCLTSMIFLIFMNIQHFTTYGNKESREELSNSKNEALLMKLNIGSKGRTKGQKTILQNVLKKNKSLQNVQKYKPAFICIYFKGRLGNQMFMYASAYGIARLKNMDLVISASTEINKKFKIDRYARVVQNDTMCKGLKRRGQRQASTFSENVLKFNNNKSITLDGFFQSFEYFENVSDEIRSQFTFRKHIQDQADSILSDIIKSHLKYMGKKKMELTLVSIHARRGRLLSEANQKYGYLVPGKEYFQKAMNWFRSKYRNTVFVVCSNGMPWCKENLKGNVYFVEGETREVDMAVLSSCDHMIMSVGTFGWWAAWLNKGNVIYSFTFVKEGSGMRFQYSKNYSDYFPPNWISM